MSNQEIVLVTGGSGFLGQHIIKQLIDKQDELGIKEIRSIDIQPYRNEIGTYVYLYIYLWFMYIQYWN